MPAFIRRAGREKCPNLSLHPKQISLTIQDKHFGCLLTQGTCGVQNFSTLISVRSDYDAVISQHVLVINLDYLAVHKRLLLVFLIY